jgi:transcriptional regulator with XRE-family HTH domain
MTISHELSEALILMDQTQRELAEKAGISRATIWYLIKKRHIGSAATADKVAAALGMRWKLVPIEENAQ